MPTARCPTCQKSFDADQTSAMPFCSDRCRDVDLGRWLDERNSIPVERDPDDIDEDGDIDDEGMEPGDGLQPRSR